MSSPSCRSWGCFHPLAPPHPCSPPLPPQLCSGSELPRHFRPCQPCPRRPERTFPKQGPTHPQPAPHEPACECARVSQVGGTSWGEGAGRGQSQRHLHGRPQEGGPRRGQTLVLAGSQLQMWHSANINYTFSGSTEETGCGDGQGQTRWAGTAVLSQVRKRHSRRPRVGTPRHHWSASPRLPREAQRWGVAWETRRQGAPGPGVLLCARSSAV